MRAKMQANTWWLHPRRLLACGLGLGLLPRAPGTWGTVLGVALYFALQPLGSLNYAVVVLVLAGVGVWLCGATAAELDSADPAVIVWDEVVGYLVCMFAAPSGWLWPLLGFVLFRCFDIFKPWPVSWADRRLHGGLGIMLDDVLAGLYALAILQAVALAVC